MNNNYPSEDHVNILIDDIRAVFEASEYQPSERVAALLILLNAYLLTSIEMNLLLQSDAIGLIDQLKKDIADA